MTFESFIEVNEFGMIMFTPPYIPRLSTGDMVDQCGLIKLAFNGRWPSAD